ncbi:MAG: pitrilysin family protein [Candidatus Pacebacteria bacterium]|nr:pitrilysin family protein [Candidatus Paceibacterota bacterium]
MKFKKKILKNGLRIITVPMKDNNTVTALVLVEAGSKYEEKNNNGISHFLEHICFKGTKNRPNPGDLSRELDGLGAETNAFTSHEFTGYYAKSHSKHTHKLVEIISDLYLNPVFNENEINKEKGVIIEEMNMYKDLPMREVYDVLMNLLYGDQPVGRTILGNPDFIKNTKIKDFVDYRDKHYVASATTVVVAGNINESAVIKDIEKRFENISESKKYKKLKVKESQKNPQIAIKHKKLDQTHLVLAVRAFDTFKKESAIVSVIAGLLGSGMSSRLFTKLREEMGVCYYVRSNNNTFTDHGYLNVSVGSDNKRVKEVISAILEEFKKLKTELVSESELKKTKEYLIGEMTMSLESSDSFAEFYGIQDILKETIESPKEKAKKIKKVTARDIKKIANKIFTNDNLNLAIVGGVDEKQKQELLKLLKI